MTLVLLAAAVSWTAAAESPTRQSRYGDGAEPPLIQRPRSVTLAGQVVKGDRLELKASFRLEYPPGKWAKVLVFEKAPSPSGFKVPRGVTLMRDAGELYCLGSGPLDRPRGSDAPDEISFEIEGKRSGQTVEFTVPVPASAAKAVAISVPGLWKATLPGGAAVETSHISMPGSGEKAVTLVRIYPSVEPEVTFSLAPERAAPEELMLSLRQRLAVELVPGCARTTAVAEGQVSGGELPSLEIDVPAGAEVLNVTGAGLGAWSLKPGEPGGGGGRTVNVSFLEPLKRLVSVELTLESEADASGACPVPALTFRAPAAGALRTPGTVSVSADARLDIVPVEAGGLEQLKSTGARLAYSFRDSGFTMSLRAVRREPKVVARCELGAVIHEDAVSIEGAIRFTTDKAGLLSLAADVGPALKILKVTGDGLAGWSADSGRLLARFRDLREGEHTLSFEAVKPAGDLAALTLRSVRVDGARNEPGFLAFSVGGRLSVTRASGDGFRQVESSALPAWLARHLFAYAVQTPGAELSVRLSELVPKVDSVMVAVADFREDALNVTLRERASVKRSPVFEHRYALSGLVEVLTVSGTKVADFAHSGGVLTVSLSSGLHGEAETRGRCHRRRESAEGGESIPLPVRMLAEHAECFLVLRHDPRLELNVPAPVGELSECPPASLPPWADSPREGDRCFRYSPPAQGEALAPLVVKVSRVAPELTAESVTLLDFEPARCRVRVELDCEVTKGGLDELTFRLPAGALTPRFECPNLKSAEASGAREGDWRLVLHGRATGRVPVAVEFSLKTPPHPQQTTFTGVEPVGAISHKGLVGFRAAKDLEVVEDLDRHVGLERQLSWPGKLAKFSDYRTVYSFASGDWRLVASVEMHGRAAVAQAQVERLRVLTIAESDGTIITRMTLTVKNTGAKQFLGLQKPQGYTLWAAYVDGAPVKASELDGGKALVPVLSGAAETSEVELLWHSPGRSLGALSSIELALPELDVEAGEASWEVRLPEGMRVLTTSGNMNLKGGPEALAHASLIALVIEGLGGLWDLLGPVLVPAGSIVVFLLWLLLLTAVIALCAWIVVRILAAILRRLAEASAARVLVGTAAALVLVALVAGLFLSAGSRSRMAPYDEIVVRTNLEKAPTTDEAPPGEEESTGPRQRTLWCNIRRSPGILETAKDLLGLGSEEKVAQEAEMSNLEETPEANLPARAAAPPSAAPAEMPEADRGEVEQSIVDKAVERSESQGGQAASALLPQQPQQRASQLDRLRQQAKQEPSVLSVEEQKEGRQKREEAQGQLEFARKLAAKGDMEKAKSYFQDVAKEAKDADSAREAEEALNALDDAAGKKKEPARRPDKTRELDAKKPLSTSTEVEVTDHFETDGDKAPRDIRGKEGAVADIPLGGTGVGGISPVTTPKTQPPAGPDSGLITHDVRDLTKKVEDFPAPDMPAKPRLPGVLAAGELVPGALKGRRQEENLLASAKAGFARGGLPLAGLGRQIEALDERPGFVFASANLGRSQGKVTLRVAPTGAAGLVDVGLVALAALAIWRACRASARAGAALSFVVAAASFVALCVGGSEVAASAGALCATGVAGLLVTGFREKFSAPGASSGSGKR